MPTSRSRPRAVLVAQAFKGTLAMQDVAAAMERGAAAAGLVPQVVPGSDGGDGLLDALAGHVHRWTGHAVTGPLGDTIAARVAWLSPEVAVVESRLACGLDLVPEDRRDPCLTTTRGVGELLRDAVLAGASRIFVGLGGSATMDGGCGAARVWGWEFLDASGEPLGEGGGGLIRLHSVRPGRPMPAEVTVLSDVRHPMTGPLGAVQFARQKGALPDAAERLAQGLERLAGVMGEPGREIADRPGAGAAGGLGFGLMCFFRAGSVPGASWVLDRQRFDEALAGAAAVVVGEGEFDATSLQGKLTGEVLERAARRSVPAVLLAPVCRVRPPGGTHVESGGGTWDVGEIERRVTAALRRGTRLSRT